MSDSHSITRKANSNLTLPLRLLPKDRRADAEIYYAFCRTIDDLADAGTSTTAFRVAALHSWKHGIIHGFNSPTPLQQELELMRERRHIPDYLLTPTIDACIADLSPQRFETWPTLQHYIWQVAIAVGLCSIRIFGCTSPEAETYAHHLGTALQLTNIIRDVREDIDNNGRIYLPLEDLEAFDLSEADLLSHRSSQALRGLLEFECNRAEYFFTLAKESLPAEDRKALKPAQAMADVYFSILQSIRQENYNVMEKRHRVPKLKKISILLKHLIA